MSEKRPRVNSEGQKELDRVEDQFKNFNESVHEAKEESRKLVAKETEPHVKMSQEEMNRSDVIYLKPKRTFPSREKFNEKFRDEFNRQSEYVEFIAENREVKGESIDFCIKKFPGQSVEEWVVPVDKPVAAPRYVKERIQDCGYTVFTTANRDVTGREGGIEYYGQMVAEERRERLAARDYVRKPRIFTGSRSYI